MNRQEDLNRLMDRVGQADFRHLGSRVTQIQGQHHHSLSPQKNINDQSKILHIQSNLTHNFLCVNGIHQHGPHDKCIKMTKTKWDKFQPYSFHKLNNQQKDQTFLQLYADYRETKTKYNQQLHKIRRQTTKTHKLEQQIGKMKLKNKSNDKQKGVFPTYQKKTIKQKDLEIQQLKQQIKRLHQKIIALTGTKNKFTPHNAGSRPKTANKGSNKLIIPVTQNTKAQLQQQRKHVRELLLIIDQLKKNKFQIQQQLKYKQATQSNQSQLRQKQNNKSKVMQINTQSQFQNYANQLHTFKQKYNDLQLIYNQMNSDKDRKIKQLSMQLITVKQNQMMKQRSERRVGYNTIDNSKMQEQIREITNQKQKLQEQIRKLVQMPFYQNSKHIVDSQQKIRDLQLKYGKAKDQLKKLNETNIKYFSQLQFKSKQNVLLKNENQKMKKQLKDMFETQQRKKSGMKAADIDYNDYYRKMLSLVKLEGDDPVWKRFATIAKPDIKLMTQQKVRNLAQQLWLDKIQLLTYLQKTQIQLKTLKQGMDSRINLYIRDKQMLQQQLKVTRARLDQWKSMDNIHHNKIYKVFQQAGIKYDDTVSVFDIDQKQMKQLDSNQNYFDLYLGNLSIDQSVLMKNPQNKIKNISHFISFLTLDFYNHETQHSNFAEGAMKKLNNNYSFKVQVNTYFLKYICKNALSIQMWSPQGTATVLLGKGQIYLSQLINKAAQDIANVARGKCQIYYQQRTLLATVQYRFRMRLPIYPFIQWAESKNQFKSSQAKNPFSLGKKRIIEITIERAEGLPPTINSFVYYTMQQQDFFSEPQRGSNPLWNFKQEIPVTVDQQFLDTLKQRYFQFTVFDDEKQVNEDVYGIAKANFTPLVDQTDTLDLLLDIQDINGNKKGKLKVKAKWISF